MSGTEAAGGVSRRFTMMGVLALAAAAVIVLSGASLDQGDESYSDAAVGDTVTDPDYSGLAFTVLWDGTVSVAAADASVFSETALEIPGTVCASDGTAYTVTQVADNAFAYCTSIASVSFPGTITAIGYNAFCECTSLVSVDLPDSLETIGPYAFAATGITSVTIPSSVTTITSFAFRSCDSLEEVVFESPSSLTYIGSEAFAFCSLRSIDLPDSLETIGDGAFANCEKLESVSIPSSVTSIEARAFVKCTSLTFVALPPSVTSVGTAAFRDCTSLAAIALPSGIADMGNYLLLRCTSLAEVYADSDAYSGYQDCFGLSDTSAIARHNYTYEAVLHGNGGELSGDTTAEVYYGIPVSFGVSASRTGYTLTGWNTDSEGGGTELDEGDAWSLSTDGEEIMFDLYAQWELSDIFAVAAGIAAAAVAVSAVWYYKKNQ
jgi:hypothetical protein